MLHTEEGRIMEAEKGCNYLNLIINQIVKFGH